MQSQLYFWEPLMGRHKKELSLVEDYYNRTRMQFIDIEKEADNYADSLYNNYHGSEDADPSSVAEWATEQGIEMYETLSIMKSNHLLMTISMLYHIWEQQLIKFTISELENHFKLETKALTYGEVQIIFKLHGVDILDTKSWKSIRELKLLVNTIKHGIGESSAKLKKIRPDFFELDEISSGDTLELSGSVLLDEYSLQVKESDLFGYVKATKSFWDEMPERAYSDAETIIEAFKDK